MKARLRNFPSIACGSENGENHIAKILTGISGLDEITRGGLPANRTTLITGGPGSGKTILALQTLVNGVQEFDEAGIFVAFEEPPRRIAENAASFGWSLPALEKESLFFLDARLNPNVVQTGEFDLTALLAAAKTRADEMGAKRIIFDAIDVLLTLMDDPAAERRELHRLQEWLTVSGLTGIITSKVDGTDPALTRRNSFMQFMADAVISLNHHVADRISIRSARVMKYRGSSFAENEAPLVIGSGGIEIASISRADKNFVASKERVSTGVERLDTMLSGGYYRGASILITGAPGTAKSTLGTAFVAAACARGERALHISFDESSAEIVRNVSSVGIDLARHVESGLLHMHSSRADATSADAQLLRLKALIEDHAPTCVVVDPVSALVKGGGQLAALTVSEGLLHVTKARGITILCTSLLDGPEPQAEASQIQISTVADTWIHVSYMVHAGERNRALTVIKSRGTAHSNQVRELVLTSNGITLADVYSAGGEVLMGTMRWLRESAEHAEQERFHAEVEHKRREIGLARAELTARQESLRRELDMKQSELDLLLQQDTRHREERQRRHSELMHKRSADKATSNGKHSARGGKRARKKQRH